MLTRLHVENFKCLREVDVTLGPLTVLIGPNDSGKSSILDALRLLGRTMREPLADIFHGDDEWRHLVWKQTKGAASFAIEVGLKNGPDEHAYTLVLSPRNQFEERPSQARAAPVPALKLPPRVSTRLRDHLQMQCQGGNAGHLADHLNQASDDMLKTIGALHAHDLLALAAAPRYRLNPEHLRRPAPTSRDAVLTPTGDNLAAVLDRLISGPDRTAIIRLEEALHKAIPTLRGIALPTVEGAPGAKTLEFVLDTPNKAQPVTIPCAHASDGAMLLTAFLALAFSDEPGMILIEEPENGLHPSRLHEVFDMLRDISDGKVGNAPRQIIVTTHSPLLLNYARPEEVRIVQRDPERGTQVTPMSAVPDVDKLLEEFAAGELWYLLGERALVEGKKP
jgi:predicted ATPase